eukprot:TRINITY_DN25496_c0_g1_i1.p1 TRINITY_DN25496_c0_g1~~TRINITY_DN25496_c0_g1_i1.p1  ORF type:complete len:365 (-),score=19.69 TRINITY_DN25496_c0_g1_i1:112-1206(-)
MVLQDASHFALSYALLGGALWGIGLLGLRIGVSECKPEQAVSLSALTSLAYFTGVLVVPLTKYFEIDQTVRIGILTDETWKLSLFWLNVGSVLSAFGSLFSVYAMSVACKHTSCLIAVVENGVYSVCSALFMILLSGEKPAPQSYLAGCCIIFGMVALPSREKTSDENQTDLISGVSKDGDSLGEPSTQHYGSTERECSVDHAQDSSMHTLRSFSCAILAGVLWSFGIVGKRYSASLVPPGNQLEGATVVYAVYLLSGGPIHVLLGVFVWIVGSLSLKNMQQWMQATGFKVFGAGIIAGIGGRLSTYALTLSQADGALFSLIIDGTYSLVGALLIACVFGERPTALQSLGAATIIGAVLLADVN